MADGDILIRRGATSKLAVPAFSPRVAVAGFALAVGLGTPAVTGSAVPVAGVQATASVGTPAVQVSSTVVNPTGVSATVSQGAITFLLGADLHLRVGSAAVIAAPAFVGGQVAQPTGQAVTASLGTATPTVINGANPAGLGMVLTASGVGSDLDATVGPDGFGLTASHGTPSVAAVAGNNVVFPVGFSLTVSRGAPVFPADAWVYPISNGAQGPAVLNMETLFAQNAPYWYLGGPVWAYSVTPVVVVAKTLAPSGQSVTASVGVPFVQAGSEQTDATVPVSGFQVAMGFNSAGTSWPVDFPPAGFGLTLGYGTALVVVTDSEAPTGYEVAVGLGIPQVTVDKSLAVTGYSVTLSQGTATVGGNFTVRPTGYRLVTSLGAPAMGGSDLTRPLLVEDRSHPRYALTNLSGPKYEVTALAHPRYWIQEVTMSRHLYFNNDDEFEFYVSRRKTSDGTVEAAAGIAGMTCHIAATPGGTAIHANLSVSATERSGAPGYYYGVFQGSDIATHLATYANKTVYRMLVNGSDIEGEQKVTVLARRPIA